METKTEVLEGNQILWKEIKTKFWKETKENILEGNQKEKRFNHKKNFINVLT